MRKFYQTEWFDIKFDTFVKLDSSKQANDEFYNKFYREFFNKYKSYDDLPVTWKKDKQLLVEFIADRVKGKGNVLSIGCGNGFIENELTKTLTKVNITAIEPSLITSSWLKSNKNICLLNGYFPQVVENKKNFDIAYMGFTEYVFDNNAYLSFLNEIKEYPINDFLLLGISVYEPSLGSNLKYFIKSLLIKLGITNQQLWGYQRTIQEHLTLFKKVGFASFSYGQLENGIYWIQAKNE